ncbi:MAG: hypothetical protein IKD14_02070 [Clostridia bacterium]|nr:hypothetical protein [Clostridia bacterium]
MKAKKKSFGIQLISILVVVAIISVGFAAWIITSPIAGDSVQGGFIAQDYIDNTFKITIDIEDVSSSDATDKQLTFGKPVDPEHDAPAFFNDGYKFSWFDYSEDDEETDDVDEGTPNEVMSVTFKVTIDPTEDENKKIEDLLLNRSVMISLTLNNGSTKYVPADGETPAKWNEHKTSLDDNGHVVFGVADPTSTQAYELYSAATKASRYIAKDDQQVTLYENAQLVTEPKMTCTYGTNSKVESDYTTKIYNTLDPTQFGAGTVKNEWADDNAISIVLPKEAFVKNGYNYVATVTLSVDWGTYFDVWQKNDVIVEANADGATHATNVNPYYFFNLQNIYKDGNTWIEQAKAAIDTIFALNYVGNTGKSEAGAGSGVQYQLSIHPIPYVDVTK